MFTPKRSESERKQKAKTTLQQPHLLLALLLFGVLGVFVLAFLRLLCGVHDVRAKLKQRQEKTIYSKNTHTRDKRVPGYGVRLCVHKISGNYY